MEKQDLALIEQHLATDVSLKKLYDEHVAFEKKLEKLNRKPFLSAEEEAEKKRLQKVKLQGRDKIEHILAQYRKALA
ncbi:MAG: DUF465 domain-containing protein [Deltaproteobacteria bacterium]|nr:DUF465 domain-containing protein [Deltaproteobacteria bacterium]